MVTKDTMNWLGKCLQEFRSGSRCFWSLFFLKQETVEECFAIDIFACLLTAIDGSATFPPEIWADPDIDSKRTMNGCESSYPTSTYTGKR